jgi:hypothetical protein
LVFKGKGAYIKSLRGSDVYELIPKKKLRTCEALFWGISRSLRANPTPEFE